MSGREGLSLAQRWLCAGGRVEGRTPKANKEKETDFQTKRSKIGIKYTKQPCRS